jgi:phage terminase large subunit-like protein
MNIEQLAQLPRHERERLLTLLLEKQRRLKQTKLHHIYPDEDTTVNYGDAGDVLYHARHKYPRHLEFFRAGKTYRERCALAANRIGKTFGMGGYEVACHLTGWYPTWWEGRRFHKPVRAWVAGKSGETTRDILQTVLLGEVIGGQDRKMLTGDGIVLGENIVQNSITWKQGTTNLIDTVKIKHITGGNSLLGFKAFNQGRGAFEGTAQDVIWGDEEIPEDVYNECVIRTATTNGIVMLTFTPLDGLTPVVLSFLPHMNPEAS